MLHFSTMKQHIYCRSSLSATRHVDRIASRSSKRNQYSVQEKIRILVLLRPWLNSTTSIMLKPCLLKGDNAILGNDPYDKHDPTKSDSEDKGNMDEDSIDTNEEGMG